MKDVRPRIKKLVANFPVPDWDPFRIFVNYTRGDAPDIPFCHYRVLKTFFYSGAKFEVLKFEFNRRSGFIEPILRITVDGIMYHIATCAQGRDELLYSIYFCKCTDLPVEMMLHYSVEGAHDIFDISVFGEVTISYEYRRDGQKSLDTRDSEVIEFFQNLVNLCRCFYLNNEAELNRML